MNSRPYGPEPYALPNCATPRYIMMSIIFVRNVLPVFGSASRAHRRFCVSSLCPLTDVPFPLSVSFTYRNPNCATPRYIMMSIIFVRNVLPVFGSASRAHRRFCVSSLCPLTDVPFPLSVSFTYRNPNCATPRYIMMSIIFVRNALICDKSLVYLTTTLLIILATLFFVVKRITLPHRRLFAIYNPRDR